MYTTFQSFRFSSLIASLVLAAAASATNAGETKTLSGVIDSIDRSSNSVTVIAEETGEAKSYYFEARPRVYENGKRFSSLSRLMPGQTVRLKVRAESGAETSREESEPKKVLKGAILRLDPEKNSALIAPDAGGRPQTVQLPEDLVVSGLRSGQADLEEGDQVTLRFGTQ